MIGTKFQLLHDLMGINASMETMPPSTSPARDPCSYSDCSRTLQYYAQLKRLVFLSFLHSDDKECLAFSVPTSMT